jgi:Flp pilus assembly pilin Flp
MTDKDRYEEFKVSGDNLLTKVRELIHEGNVRRVFIKNEDGATILEIPLTAGLAVTVITAAFSPVLVAVGAIAALLTQVTVGVERRDSDDDQPSGEGSGI